MSEKPNMRKWDHDTSSKKMKSITGSAQNYESPSDKASRMCRGGYADGGRTPQPSDLYSPSELKELSKPQNMGVSDQGQSQARALGSREAASVVKQSLGAK